MVSFNVTDEEDALIEKIAIRASREVFRPSGINQTRFETEMDLAATIAQGCPLKLAELLEADALDFAHDVKGIRQHINRETGKLENCFLPRFARL